MSLAGWLAALAVGTLAGGLSGLIGIGGGAIMVPFLYFLLGHPGISGIELPATQQAVVAHATSLLAIVPISARGAWLYHRAGLVDWAAVGRVGAASAVAALLGARIAIALPGELLKAVFGVFLIAAGVRLVVPRSSEKADERARVSLYTLRCVGGGLVVGLTSAVLGVGGGLVAIPVLIYLLKLPLNRVSATSLAVIVFTATAGVISYAIAGWGDREAVAGTLAYLELPAGLALVLGALLAVPLGTRIQRRMPTAALRWLFSIVFLLLGARLAIANWAGFSGP